MSVGRDPLMNEPSYSITGFCVAENISESTYHKLRGLGYGPDEMRFPDSPMVRITTKARRAWHVRMEQLRKIEAAKLAGAVKKRAAK